jgi:hypothetical protein
MFGPVKNDKQRLGAVCGAQRTASGGGVGFSMMDDDAVFVGVEDTG